MCAPDRHALLRTYEAGVWYLACAYPECGHRITEGGRPVEAVPIIEEPEKEAPACPS